MRVRTDLKITGTTIRISMRLAKMLDCRAGQVLTIVQDNGECYLGTNDNPGGMLYGKLYNTHGGFRCSNAVLARQISHGHSRCEYRCGESVTINGKKYVTIITSKNYADRKN